MYVFEMAKITPANESHGGLFYDAFTQYHFFGKPQEQFLPEIELITIPLDYISVEEI